MEVLIRAAVMFLFLWLVTRAVGRSTLGEISTFQLVLYVTLGDLVQQAVTQQDYSLTGGAIAISTFAMLTVTFSWIQWRFPRTQPLIVGRPVMLFADGGPVEQTMRQQRLTMAEFLAAARQQGIRQVSEIEYAVLEANGKISFFTRESPTSGSSQKPDVG